MGVLQRFERRLGGLVEGAFARVFKGGVEPVEIAGALARECDDKRAVGPSRTLVPNDFTVELGPADHEHLAPYASVIAEELAALVREHAAEQRYSFVGPVRVRFAVAADLALGVFRVRSGVSAAEEPPPAQVEHDAPPARIQVRSSPGAEDGEVALEGTELLIGRAADAGLRLTDSGVSRRHAALRRHPDGWWLEDLGSTNGTLVNGAEVTRVRLDDGDRIELGASVLVFRAGGG